MKKILFAIASERFNSDKVRALEEAVCNELRIGSREYADLTSSLHCDYKDAIARMCTQERIDVLVVNENLQGQGDLLSILKEIKSELPAITIVMLLTQNRGVGDAFLANAVASGVYNWVVAPWSKKNIANVIISPKKMKDVEMYMPKIIEGKNGLAFDTVVVEKKAEALEDLNDLPDLLGSNTNNGTLVNGVNDLGAEKTNKSIGYSRKMFGSKFGFGKAVKPKAISHETQEEIPVKPEPVELKMESIPPVEEPKTEIQKESPVEKPKFSFAEFYAKKEEELKTLEDKKPIEEIKEEIKEEVKPQTEIEDVKPAEGTESKANQIKAPDFKPTKMKPKKPEVEDKTIGTIKFTPKYQRILFIRALPLTSAIPAHIASLTKFRFVDLNKNDNSNVGYFDDMVKTNIKECELPEGPIVADVIVGNGVEKIIDKFDHVVVIFPEDLNVIKEFVKRYPFIKDCGVVLDKCTSGVLPIVLLRKNIPNCLYIDTVKTELCNKVLAKSCENRILLTGDKEYYQAIKWLLKDLEA